MLVGECGDGGGSAGDSVSSDCLGVSVVPERGMGEGSIVGSLGRDLVMNTVGLLELDLSLALSFSLTLP